MKLVKTLAFLLVGTVTFGSLQTPARAANDSSENSSNLSSYINEEEEIVFDIEDEAELTEDYEDKKLDSEKISEEAISDEVIVVEEKSIDEEAAEAESTDEEEILEEEDELPEDFYTEYPTDGVIDVEPLEEIESVSIGQRRLFRTASLAAEYTTPDLPLLRRQNPYGTCWAFATTALAEINLMKNGYMPDPDMSELHLAYFTYNTETDPLGGTEGDTVSRGASGILNFGGKTEWGLNTFTRWIGVADEDTVPYSLGEDANSVGLDSSLAYASSAHIVNIFEEPIEHDVFAITATRHSNIKKLIQNCGAAAVEYYAYNSMSAATTDKIYKVKTNGYYNPDKPKGVNHAVVIVGWDDSFPATNFATTAPGDGAFLVRNSWIDGSGTGSDYTYAGYFWMSYYETSLSNYAYAAEFAPADNYANNYQYDAGLAHGTINLTKAANVFTTHARGGESGERLEAVSFYTPNSNVSYTIDIYTDLEDPSNPVSGKLIEEATTQGTTSYAGFYTIELLEPVDMRAGTTFAVVLTVQKNGGNAGLGVEYNYSYGQVSISPGQSFIYTGGKWKDLTNVFPSGNFSIKAYTNNIEMEEVGTPKIDINDLTMINYKESYEYSGAECKQKTVKLYMTTDSGKVYLTEGEDYTVEYDTDDLINCGTKNVTYTGIGDYIGTITKSYKIRAYNLSRDLDLKTPCISVAFENGEEPDENGIYSFTYVDGGVFPEPQLTYTSSKCSQVMVKDVDYTIKYSNNTECNLSSDLDSLKITITGIDNFIRNYVIYFYITPQLISRPTSIQVSFDGNGAAKGTVASQVVNILEPKELNTNKFIKNGSVFMGWAASKKDADAGIVAFQDKEIVDSKILNYCGNSEELTLYAVWRSEFYITYDTKGGQFPEGVEELNVYTFGKIQDLPKPVKEGHRFVGWYTDETYQTQLLGIKSRTSGDYDLVAKWEAYPYTITFSGNGSTSGEMSVQSGEYGTPITLNANQFQRTGYRFVGWNSVKAPTSSNPGISYSDKETITKTPASKNVRYILYAQWEKISK